MKAAFLVTSFEFSKDGLVIGLSGGHEVENDARQFVRGIFDGLHWAEASALRAVVIAQVGFVVVKALSSHTEFFGDSVLGFDLRTANAATCACAVFGTDVHPGRKTVRVWKLGRQIGTEFTKDGLNAEG